MRRSLFINLVVVLFIFHNFSYSQAWQDFTNGDNISSILADDNTLWVATTGGLVKLNLYTSETEVFTKSNSGLNYNRLSALAIDNNENLWIGTKTSGTWEGGLSKYDGVNWEVFTHFNSELSSPDITSIAVDNDNNIWVGTKWGGTSKFDGENWTVWDEWPWHYVKTIAVSPDNSIWLGTQNNGLLKYNGDTLIIYNNQNSGIGGNDIQSLEFDTQGNLWIGTEAGHIKKFDGTNWTSKYYESSRAYSLATYGNNNAWVGYSSDGIVKIAGSSINYNTSNSDLPTNYIHAVELDFNENLWVGTWKDGLGIFTTESWNPVNTSGSGLPCNWVGDFLLDWNGNNYVATFYGGVTTFDGTEWQMLNNDSIFYNSYNHAKIAHQGDSILWLGTNDGLIKYEGLNWSIYDTLNSNIPGNNIRSIDVDNAGNVWMGIWDKGLAKFDGENWYLYDDSNSPALLLGISNLEIDNYDNLWLGTHYSGLIMFDGFDNWEIYNIENSDIPSDDIRSLHIDESNNIYVGGYWGGLGIYDGSIWTIYNETNAPFITDWVTAILKRENELWVGTAYGLYKLENDEWTEYQSYNSGLPSRYILALDSDAEGKLWIGMYEGGMAIFDESQLTEIEESQDEVLQSGLTVYPNPVSQKKCIRVVFENHINQERIVSLCNLHGEQVYEKKFFKQKEIEITTNHLKKGTYILSVSENHSLIMTKKIVVL